MRKCLYGKCNIDRPIFEPGTLKPQNLGYTSHLPTERPTSESVAFPLVDPSTRVYASCRLRRPVKFPSQFRYLRKRVGELAFILFQSPQDLPINTSFVAWNGYPI